jgi:hypothetical protein
MRNFLDLNNICSEIIMAIRLRIFEYYLDNNWAVVYSHVDVPYTTEFSRLSLPLCLGENDEIMNDHWIHAK